MKSASGCPARWDHAGIIASALCLIHCVVLPLLLIAMPALGFAWLADEWTHRILIFLLMLMASAAFVAGYRLHRRALIPVVAILALGLLSFAAFGVGAWLQSDCEKSLTVTGSILLIAAHGMNLRLRRLPRFPLQAGNHARH